MQGYLLSHWNKTLWVFNLFLRRPLSCRLGPQHIPQKSNEAKTVFLFVWLQPLPHNKTLSCFHTTNVMLPLFSQWSNLCIDLVSFTAKLFKTAVFRTLDSIAVCANCKIRRIFTMKTEATDTSGGGGHCGGMTNTSMHATRVCIHPKCYNPNTKPLQTPWWTFSGSWWPLGLNPNLKHT